MTETPSPAESVERMDLAALKRVLEAAILAASHPLTLPQLAALFDEFATPSHEELARALEALQTDCEARGIELAEVSSGFRYQVKRDVYPHIARLWTERQTRYSRALLETLSLIAYRQPITRAEIEQVRGVAVSTHMVQTLEERDWIRVVGHRDLPGRPALFGTTRAFLDYFNLKSLDELPPLGELRDLDSGEVQLDLENTAIAPIGVATDAGEAASDEPSATAAVDAALSRDPVAIPPTEAPDPDSAIASSEPAPASIASHATNDTDPPESAA